MSNYADGSTSYYAGKSAEFVVNNLEQSSAIIFEWLNNNYVKVNTGQSHLLLSSNSTSTATIDNSYIESDDEQVLLGIAIDSNLLKTISIAFARKQVKVKCPCKNCSLHEYTEASNNHEVFCNFSIQLLPVNLDVPQQTS